MKLRILLVNPWVYDFAAFNLWSRPLGLMKVAEYLSAFDVELGFIDCMEQSTERQYGTGKYRSVTVEKPVPLETIPRRYKRYGIPTEEFRERLRRFLPVDLVMVTCLMTYWYPGVQEVVATIRETARDVPVILGGAYATLNHQHASEHSGADLIFTGQAGKDLEFALYTFGYRLKQCRERQPYYRLGLYGRHPFAALLTSTGCPFSCSYCASHLLSRGYRRRPPGEVLQEIMDLYTLGVRDFAFYDDALLVDFQEHLEHILRGVIHEGISVRFHTPNGLHARYVGEHAARLMQAANFTTIRLSLETVDMAHQQSIGDKVTIEDVERAVAVLRRCGFSRRSIGIYLMYGLPGQKIGEVREGIEFLDALDVRINLVEFSPIRGTEAWRKLVDSGTIPDDLDPLLTNNTVFHYLHSAFDPAELEALKLRVKELNSR
ncbi:MAG: B12-binding domain-containing radical SAM protein [Chloroflexota bacterium]